MTDDTCDDCGEPVHKTRTAVYNLDPSRGLLHRQSCENPSKPKPESEASVRRRYRL